MQGICQESRYRQYSPVLLLRMLRTPFNKRPSLLIPIRQIAIDANASLWELLSQLLPDHRIGHALIAQDNQQDVLLSNRESAA
jgi:hypothetical protein